MNHKKNYKFFHRIYLAISGIAIAFKRERHLRLHLLFSLIIIIPGLILSIPTKEIILLCSITGLLIIMELFNTSIELTVDLVTKQFSHRAKLAKDIASGAVLLSASLVLMIAITIYSPYVSPLLTGVLNGH